MPPASDPWDPSAFGLTPVGPGKASDAPASAPGRAVSRPGPASADPWDPSAFGLKAVADAPPPEPAAAAQPVAAAPTRDGMIANIAAGPNEAIATNAGAPADLVAGALNLVPRGINAVAGTHLPTIQDPVGGSAWIKRNVLGSVGANPDDVVAATPEQRMARALSGGAVSALLPGGAVAGLGRAGLIAAETVPAVMGITGGMTPGNAALGAVSGLGSGGSVAPVVRLDVTEPAGPLPTLGVQHVLGDRSLPTLPIRPHLRVDTGRATPEALDCPMFSRVDGIYTSST